MRVIVRWMKWCASAPLGQQKNSEACDEEMGMDSGLGRATVRSAPLLRPGLETGRERDDSPHPGSDRRFERKETAGGQRDRLRARNRIRRVAGAGRGGEAHLRGLWRSNRRG